MKGLLNFRSVHHLQKLKAAKGHELAVSAATEVQGRCSYAGRMKGLPLKPYQRSLVSERGRHTVPTTAGLDCPEGLSEQSTGGLLFLEPLPGQKVYTRPGERGQLSRMERSSEGLQGSEPIQKTRLSPSSQTPNHPSHRKGMWPHQRRGKSLHSVAFLPPAQTSQATLVDSFKWWSPHIPK